MLAKMKISVTPLLWVVYRAGKCCPLITLYLMHLLVGLALIGAVGLIALSGGAVIWLVYSLLGVL